MLIEQLPRRFPALRFIGLGGTGCFHTQNIPRRLAAGEEMAALQPSFS